MPISLAPGVTVQVDPPVMPTVRAAPPQAPTVTVLPVAGPQGPAGPAGAGYHRHEQTTPAAVVDIEHGFGRWPAAILLTSPDGTITFTAFRVEMLDVDTVRISIDKPTAYVALIS